MKGKKSILVVEDEKALARMLKRHLEMEGYDVHTEGCGATALSYAAKHPPHLVVLDLRLPDMGGLEVCRKLRQNAHPWVPPIVMLTAMDRPADQLRGFAYGADAYLCKPCPHDELVRTIELLLGGGSSSE